MLTILNAIELSTAYLEKKQIEDSRINAELLLADILNCKRMDLYLKFDQPLSEEETVNYRKYIKRRGSREPLQYIIGLVEFYGLEFMVNPSVLIPRPDTEILVEEIINRYDKDEVVRILDIGTGSGNIAISLSKNLKNATVHSIDVNEEAKVIAQKNSELNKCNGNLTFENIDVNAFEVSDDLKYDVIVSNPPYIAINEYHTLEEELINHEPQNALTDNGDGYSFYTLISKKAKTWLNKKGNVFFEVGYSQAEKVSEILKDNDFGSISAIKDYQDIDRVVTGKLN